MSIREREQLQGMSERDLLIELHVRFDGLFSTVEDHSKTIKELKTESDQQKGAIKFLRGATALLAAIGAVIGSLWWTR